MTELRPGEVIAGYVMARRIVAGGSGVVYVARHPRLPGPPALTVTAAGGPLPHTPPRSQRTRARKPMWQSLFHRRVLLPVAAVAGRTVNSLLTDWLERAPLK